MQIGKYYVDIPVPAIKKQDQNDLDRAFICYWMVQEKKVLKNAEKAFQISDSTLDWWVHMKLPDICPQLHCDMVELFAYNKHHPKRRQICRSI